MKYKPVIWLFMTSRMKKGLKEIRPDNRTLLKKAKPIYKDLLSRMKGISDNNPMASNITMSFVIISIWLASERKITPDQMSEVMKIALNWKPMKVFCGMIDMNTDMGIRSFGKMMHKNADWAENHPEDTNNWDFNFDESRHRDGSFYYFTRCPLNTFARKHGFIEILPVCCELDHLLTEASHGKLIREYTLATGGPMCDYWIVPDQLKNPQ